MIFRHEMDSREWLWLLWNGKYRILACALAAAIVGVLIVTTIPKVYETSLVARPASEAAFVPFSDLLSVAPGNWHSPSDAPGNGPSTANMIATAKRVFLAFARDRDNLRTFVLSHQDLMPQAKLDDPDVLQKIVNEHFDVVPSKDTSDDSVQFRFRYGTGTSGAQLLNSFVRTLIEKTAETLNENGRSMLAAAKKSKENDLGRLREIRDIRVRQLILEYQEALDVAKSAGIEKPAISMGSTSPLAATGQTPLFLFGSQVLTTELKNIEARKGNDLAIPEFSSIASSIADLSRRVGVLDQTLGTPIVITQLAYEGRPIFPPKTPIMLMCVAIGATLGGCWQYLKSRKPAAKPQA